MDVPSPINLQDMDDAKKWASESMKLRPYRVDVFELFAQEIGWTGAKRIIEIGSGPGFLMEHILKSNSELNYTAFDFSSAMHQLAKEKVISIDANPSFVVGDFTKDNWTKDLGTFDAVISLQAVHEVRHKTKVPRLFTSIATLLNPGALFLYCDHVCDGNGMKNNQLYMSEGEQRDALASSGFRDLEKLRRTGSLAVWRTFK